MINRRRRTRVLAEGRSQLASELAALIESRVEVIEVTAPHQGLVMCQVRETARNSRFYLGEALMTECRVRIGDTEGLGAVLGMDDERARAMAVVDAALSQPVPLDVAPEIERRLLEAESELDRKQERLNRQVMASKVSFDTMGGQDMSVQAVVK